MRAKRRSQHYSGIPPESLPNFVEISGSANSLEGFPGRHNIRLQRLDDHGVISRASHLIKILRAFYASLLKLDGHLRGDVARGFLLPRPHHIRRTVRRDLHSDGDQAGERVACHVHRRRVDAHEYG